MRNWGSGNVSNKHNEATITFDTPERDATHAEMRHGKQARGKIPGQNHGCQMAKATF